MKRLDIMKVEDQQSLEMRLDKIRTVTRKDASAYEEKVSEELLKTLYRHGKDANLIRQIGKISKVLANSLGLDTEYCERLEKAARIYDIGNIAIDKAVYQKDDRLSFEEFEIVKNHTLIGHDILISLGLPLTDLAAVISAEHHEWWNGGGYPSGIKYKELNIASRIVALADTAGSLFRERPGRKAWSYTEIVKYITARAHLQFDPDVVDVLTINRSLIHDILCTNLDSSPSNWYH